MKNPAYSSSEIPETFLDRMSQLLGDEFSTFLASLYQPDLAGLRVNTIKIFPSEYKKLSPFTLLPVKWCPSGFIIQQSTNPVGSFSPGKHPFHAAGLYYLHEPSAMAAAEALSPLQNLRVLDISAAPGGKATHLAALMQNSGILIANEIHPKRVKALAENLERCGITNAVVTNESPSRLADHFGEFFDRILVDAPCSGEGMFRKSETARKEWQPDLIQACVFRQTAILDQAVRLLKPGGLLAYTTCTFSPEENEGVVASFLDAHPEFDTVQIQYLPGFDPANPGWIGLPLQHRVNKAIRIWPHHADGEGHFVALLEKHKIKNHYLIADGTIRHESANNKHKNISVTDIRLLEDFFCTNLNIQFNYSRVVSEGSYLYQLPDDCPDLSNLNVIHRGLWLGSVKNYHFIPSHSLAMALKENQVKQVIHLHPDSRYLTDYLSGSTLAIPGDDGWVLISVEGYPLGWGKRVQNVIKNHYPHGLRKYSP